eukprot:m.150968 g.150968  ORF g.150968 m.150968 type:complete len:2035 (+) comp16189_c0_seq1:329-6433(+)
MADIPAHIRQIFEHVDADGSGYLDHNELENVLQQMGISDTHEREQKLKELVTTLDPDGDGKITLEEFWQGAHLLGLAQIHKDRSHLLLKATTVFDEIDQDGDGELDEDELTKVALKLGVMEADLKQIVSTLVTLLDHDGNGTVSRDEFMLAVQQGHLDTLLESATTQSNDTFASYDTSRESTVNSRRPLASQFSLGDDDEDVYNSLRSDHRLSTASQDRQLPERTPKTQGIPDSKYRFLWDVFCVADDDCSGQISEDELFELLNDETLFGKTRITRNLLSSVMNSIDEDDSGTLDFEEFCVAFDQLFDEDKKKQNKGILGAENEALVAENERLTKLVEKQKEEIQMLSGHRLATGDRRALEDEVRQLQEYNEAKDEQLRFLQEAKTSLEERLREARQTIAELERSLNEQKDQTDKSHNKSRVRAANEDEYAEILELQEEVEQLRQELILQSTHFREEVAYYHRQLGLAEMQLEEMGAELLRVPELQEEVSFLSQLSQELRSDLRELVDRSHAANQEAESLAINIETITSLEDAMAKLAETVAQKREVEVRFHHHMDKSQQVRTALEARNKQLSDELQASQTLIEQLKERTAELFHSQRTEYEQKLEQLEADLAEAREAQRKWEEYQANDSVRARVNNARLRLKSSSELSDQMRALQRELDEAQERLRQSQEEFDNFKQQTAEMWQLHKDNQDALLTEAYTEADRLKEELLAAQEALDAQARDSKARVEELEQHVLELRAIASQTSPERLQGLELQVKQIRDATITELTSQHTVELKRIQTETQTQLHDMQTSMDSARRDADAQINNLTHEIASLRQQLQEKIDALDVAAGKIDMMQEQHKMALQNARQQGAESEAIVVQLRDQLAKAKTAQSDLERVQAELAARCEERDQLLEALASVNDRVQQLEAELNDVKAAQGTSQQEALRQQQADKARYEQELDAKNKEIEALRAQLAELEQRHQLSSSNYDLTIEDLNFKLTQEREQLALLTQKNEQALSSTHDDVLRLQQQLSDARTAHAERERDLSEQLEASEKELAATLEQTSNQLADMATQLEAVQSELNEAKQARARALEEFQQAVAAKQRDMDDLQAVKEQAILDLKRQLEELTARMNATQLDHETAVSDLQQQMQHALAEAAVREKEQTAVVDGLRLRLATLEAHASEVDVQAQGKLKAVRTELAAQMEQLQAERDAATQRAEQLAQQLVNAEAEFDASKLALQTQIRELENALKGKTRELEREQEMAQQQQAKLMQQQERDAQELDLRNQHLQKQNQVLQAEIDKLVAIGSSRTSPAVRSPDEVLDKLEADNKSLRKQVANFEVRLRQQNEDHDMRVRELQALFDSERMKFDLHLRDERAKTLLAQDELERSVTEKDKALEELRARLAAKNQQLDEATTSHADLVSDLRQQLIGAEQTLEALKREKELLQRRPDQEDGADDRAKLLQDMTHLQQELVATQTKLSSESDRANQLEASIQRMQQEFKAKLEEQRNALEAGHAAAIDKLNIRMQQLESDALAAQAETQRAHALEEQVNTLNQALDASRAELAAAASEHQQQLQQLQQQLQQQQEQEQGSALLLQQLEEKTERLQALQQERASASSAFAEQLAAANALVDERDQKLQDLHAEMLRLKDELASAERALQDAALGASKGNHEEQALKQELSEAQDTISRLSQENEELKARVETLVQEIREMSAKPSQETTSPELEKLLEVAQVENQQLKAELARRDAMAASSPQGPPKPLQGTSQGLSFEGSGMMSGQGSELSSGQLGFPLLAGRRQSASDDVTSATNDGWQMHSDVVASPNTEAMLNGSPRWGLEGSQVELGKIEAEQRQGKMPPEGRSSSSSIVVVDVRIRQLQIELEKALRERDEVALEFQSRLAHLQARLEQANEARDRLAKQLAFVSQSRYITMTPSPEDSREVEHLQLVSAELQEEVKRLRSMLKQQQQQRQDDGLASRLVQLELELQRALNERDTMCEEFRENMLSMREQLRRSEQHRVTLTNRLSQQSLFNSPRRQSNDFSTPPVPRLSRTRTNGQVL